MWGRNIDVRERYQLVAFCTRPQGALNLQPGCVPWLGIEPVTLPFVGRCPTNWAMSSRAASIFFTVICVWVFFCVLFLPDFVTEALLFWNLYWMSLLWRVRTGNLHPAHPGSLASPCLVLGLCSLGSGGGSRGTSAGPSVVSVWGSLPCRFPPSAAEVSAQESLAPCSSALFLLLVPQSAKCLPCWWGCLWAHSPLWFPSLTSHSPHLTVVWCLTTAVLYLSSIFLVVYGKKACLETVIPRWPTLETYLFNLKNKTAL